MATVSRTQQLVSWFLLTVSTLKLQHNLWLKKKNHWAAFINIPRIVSAPWNPMKAKVFLIKQTCLTYVLRLSSVLFYCWKVFFWCFSASLMSECFRSLNKTCDLANQKLTFYPSAHLFSLTLLWCYINGLWNRFKPEAFMSCKLTLIGLIFFCAPACDRILLHTKSLYGMSLLR